MESIDEFTQNFHGICKDFLSGTDDIFEFICISSKERSICHEIAKQYNIITETITFPHSTDKFIVLKKEGSKENKKEEKHQIRVQDIEAFQKHSGISIPIPLPEYITYYIEIFDEYFDAKKKWEYYEDDLKNKFDNNPQKILEHINTVCRKIIEDIQSNDKFKAFIDLKIETPKTPKINGLYNIYNKDKTFLSLDIRSANYTMIRTQVDGLFETHDWKDFVSKYTDSKFVRNSKYFREYIFGELNACNKTKKLAKAFMDSIVIEMETEFQMNASDLVYREGDELVYKFDGSKLAKIRKYLHGKYPNMLHVTSFILRQLSPMKHFVKEQDDGTVDFKCIEKIYMCQAVKKYSGKPIVDNDLKFIHNGMIAIFERSCYN